MTEEERIAELERQLATEREARLRAEAASAAFRASLEEIRQWAYCMPVLLTGLDEPPEDGQFDEYVHGQIARLAQRALLASPDLGADLLEVLPCAGEQADHFANAFDAPEGKAFERVLLRWASESQRRVEGESE